VIAGGQNIGPAIVKLTAKAFGQTTPGRGVFGIDDDKIERELLAQRRHVSFDRLPSRPAHNVSAEEDVHESDRAVPEGGAKLRGEAGSAVGVQLLRGPP